MELKVARPPTMRHESLIATAIANAPAAAKTISFDIAKKAVLSMFGTAISLGVVIIAFAVMLLTPGSAGEGRILIGCLIAGWLGAVVSVMSQISFGGLALDYEGGRRTCDAGMPSL